MRSRAATRVVTARKIHQDRVWPGRVDPEDSCDAFNREGLVGVVQRAVVFHVKRSVGIIASERSSAESGCSRWRECKKGIETMSEIIERYDRAMALKEGGDLESAVEELNGIVADEPDHVLSHSRKCN